MAISSGSWGISTAGAMTGIGNITSNGSVVLNGTATGINSPLFSIGTYSTPAVFTPALADDVVPFQIKVSSATDATSNATSLMGGYFGVVNTGAMVHRQLQGILSSVTMNNNTFAAYGVQGTIDVTAGNATGSTGNGNIAGLSGKVDVNGTTTAGVVSAGLFTIDGTGSANTGTASTNGVWIEAGGATTPVTNGLLISGNITNDVVLHTGAKILSGATSDQRIMYNRFAIPRNRRRVFCLSKRHMGSSCFTVIN